VLTMAAMKIDISEVVNGATDKIKRAEVAQE
jgi:hypothetical protein